MEFGLVAPLVMLVLVAVADIGNAIQQSVRLETAVRAGAQYAFSFSNNPTQIRAQVQSALDGWTNVTVATPTMVCRCPGVTGTVDCATYAICPTSLERYMTITATRPFTPVVIPSLTTLTGRVDLRLQ